MHEATIAQSILDIVAAKLQKNCDANCVKTVAVRIGEFRNVDCDSLSFAFDSLKGLYCGLSDCELSLESIKALAWCREASHTYNPSIDLGFCCPKCGGGIGQLINGEELDIAAITMSTHPEKEMQDRCTSQPMNTL
jgi:hydrogenase nickel incorporation protein HypA/HybF